MSLASVEDAQDILKALGMPPAQHNRLAGLTLLALCRLTPDLPWRAATRSACTLTKGIMDYLRDVFDSPYAPNTRETFRRQVLHQFVQGGIAEYNPFEPDLPTNSPRAHYAITEAALRVVSTYGRSAWQEALDHFRQERETLIELYSRDREASKIPVKVPTGTVLLSPGEHNLLQRAVIEEFAPRFVPGAALLYLGDTAEKDLYVDEEQLGRIGILLTSHDKLPDVLLYDEAKDLLFFVEAVTSHGPITPKRLIELEQLAERSSVRCVYVTAFLDQDELLRHFNAIAWETDVWTADEPDHLIHRDGDRFIAHATRSER